MQAIGAPTVRSPRAVVWGWLALVSLAALWGTTLLDEAKLFAPPLFGRFDIRLSIRLVAPLIVGVVTIAFAPRIARSIGWRAVLAGTVLLSAVWIVSLASASGPEDIARPLDPPTGQL